MNEQYQTGVREPMFHLAERNLLLKVFRERIGQEKIIKEASCEIKLILCRGHEGQRRGKAVFGVSLQRGENAEKLPRRMVRQYRIDLYGGWFSLLVQVRRSEELSEAEKSSIKILVADMAETLKLLANGDGFMKTSVEKLVAKIARETGIEDPTAWTQKYLEPPKYMQRPEVRRYYRLYNKHLNHAKPQDLLHRKVEELVETPV